MPSMLPSFIVRELALLEYDLVDTESQLDAGYMMFLANVMLDDP